MYKRLLAERERAVGQHDCSATDGMAGLAKLYWTTGQLQEAQILYEETIERRRKTLPESHPVVLSDLASLGIIYEEQGLLDKGILVTWSALRKQELVDEVGETSHLIVKLRNTLARIYRKQGRNEEAKVIENSLGELKLEDNERMSMDDDTR